MSTPQRCGPDCVFPVDLGLARPLSMSSRADDAWIIGETVVRRIAAGGHDREHPFHVAGTEVSIGDRADLLRYIGDATLAGVVPVEKVCHCSYTSPLLKGGPIRDFGLSEDGNRLIHPNARLVSWPIPELERLLGELAKGLAELHGLGVAHGDPALMNAYVHEREEGTSAVWVDLNSLLPASPETVALDIAAFESTCLWPALLDTDRHSPSLVDDLIAIACDDDEPHDAYAIALSEHRSDHLAGSARSVLIRCLAERDPLGKDDNLGAVRRRVAGAMAPLYFLDQTKSDQSARFFLSTLTHERVRHRLIEEERTRLHGIRYQGEIAALNERLRELIAEIETLTQAREDVGRELPIATAELELYRNALGQLEAEVATLSGDLNAIYDSRAWRLVSWLRSLIAIPSRIMPRIRASRSLSDQPPLDAVNAGRPSKAFKPRIQSYPYSVSVIMPVYNKGATIRESVESVLSQTLASVEIVLWDDQSTDRETMRVLAEIAELPNVTLFRGANQGVVGARNSAIAFSRGRYICCLDPDDLIAPTYLETAVALLESQPEYDIAYPWVRSIGDVDELWETQDLDPALITTANHVPICAVFHRDVFNETGGFSEEMQRGYEDWEFWTHAAELGFRGKAIPSHLFSYRFSLDTSKSRDAQARESHQHLVDKIADLHPGLAQTGVPLQRHARRSAHPVGRELGPRRLPRGKGHPVVLTLPWFTVGGADTTVESLIRNWVHEGRTVVVCTTTPLAPGMVDRRVELSRLTPYIYHLHDFLPRDRWYEYLAGVVSSLESPVLFNVGSPWFYDVAEHLRTDFPRLRIVDQQFNTIGHIEGNRKVANAIDLTIAAYAGLAKELKDQRTSAVIPIYIGLDEKPRPHSADIEDFRRRANLGLDEKFVLFVGRLAEEKRPDWAIRLAKELEDIGTRVVLVGDGPLRDRVAEESKFEQAVTWIPDLDVVEPAIATAEALVIPSRVEGIPLVAMESVALGTAVVATRVGGLPDLERVPGITLVGPDDFDGFASAVRAALHRPEEMIGLPDRFSLHQMLADYDQALFPDEDVSSQGSNQGGGQGL